MVAQNKSKSNSGIRNLVTRSNMIMLIMVTTIVLQVTALVLSLTGEGSRANIEAIFKGDTARRFKIATGRINPGDEKSMYKASDAQLTEFVIVSLSSVMLFIVGAVHILNMLLLNHKGLRILSTLALLVVASLVCAYLFMTRDNIEEPSKLQTIPLNVVRANAILSLIYSILQFLSILRP